MLNMESFSVEFKNVLAMSNELAQQHGREIIRIDDVLMSVFKYKQAGGTMSSEGYKIFELWADDAHIDLTDFINFFEERYDIENEHQDDSTNSELKISSEVSELLMLATCEAKNFGISTFGSEFFVLAIAIKYPEYFSFIETAHNFNDDTIKEIIGQKLKGAGNIGPEGLNNTVDLSEGNGATPALNAFSIDLTAKARNNSIDPIIGRTKEMDRISQILFRKTKNNPILIGEPGIGKTAIVEGFAQKLVDNNENYRVMQLNMANLLAGTRYRGDFEERLRIIIKELTENKNVIVFIDEVHNLIGAGNAEGAMDAANILKPSLARGEFKMIGATTTSEYRKYIEKDAAFERRLQPIMVNEPTLSETISILKGCKKSYEDFHHIIIDESSIDYCVKWSAKYVSDKHLPDKAFDILDETCSKLVLNYKNIGVSDLDNLKKERKILNDKKSTLLKEKNFVEAKKIDVKEKEVIAKIEQQTSDISDKKKTIPIVRPIDIAGVIADITGIDAKQLNADEVERLFNMEEELKKDIKGQDEAVSAVCRSIIRWRSGVNNPKKPICNIMSLGPTGTGKTELAKCLAKYMFGSEDRLIKIDMSEYSTSIDVSKLLGSTYGYVGYGEESALVKKIRSHPHSVILFDEITRGHKDMYPLFLQLMDEGVLTTGDGKQLDFRNAIVFFTSNLGADKIFNIDNHFGFNDGKDKDGQSNMEIKNIVMKEVEKEFPPEFINRLDKVLVFNKLTKNLLLDIVDIKIGELSKRIERNLTITDNAKNRIIDYNYDSRYGARPILRSISDNIEDSISELILRDKISKDINIDYIDAKFVFNGI